MVVVDLKVEIERKAPVIIKLNNYGRFGIVFFWAPSPCLTLSHLDVVDVLNVLLDTFSLRNVALLGLPDNSKNWDLLIFGLNLGGFAVHFLGIVRCDVDHISSSIRWFIFGVLPVGWYGWVLLVVPLDL